MSNGLHRQFIAAKTQFISSLIASWGSKTEQTQAQNGFQAF
jgi:hypothetical protein